MDSKILWGGENHPGKNLHIMLKSIGMTKKELSIRMGRPAQAISEITNCKKQITPQTAVQLEYIFPISAEKWLKCQMLYNLNEFKKETKKW